MAIIPFFNKPYIVIMIKFNIKSIDRISYNTLFFC